MAVKTAFHASRESFSTITTFFETINFFLSFWNSELKKFRSLAFCFRPRCQKCNSRVQKTLRGKIIEVNLLKWEHFWPFFEVWTEKNFDGSKRHNNRSVETAFPVSKGTFWRKQFFWKNYKFDEKACTLSKKKSDFRSKIETELSKHLFFYVQENREEKPLCRERLYFSSLFAAFERKKRLTFALNCWHECLSWNLSVRRKKLTKILFFWKKN